MTDFPSFIESMTLEKVVIGSNLPTISNAALHSMTELGEVVPYSPFFLFSFFFMLLFSFLRTLIMFAFFVSLRM